MAAETTPASRSAMNPTLDLFDGDPRPQVQLGGRAVWGADGRGYNVRTAGGDLMSDGNCAFVAGVPVGNC